MLVRVHNSLAHLRLFLLFIQPCIYSTDSDNMHTFHTCICSDDVHHFIRNHLCPFEARDDWFRTSYDKQSCDRTTRECSSAKIIQLAAISPKNYFGVKSKKMEKIIVGG